MATDEIFTATAAEAMHLQRVFRWTGGALAAVNDINKQQLDDQLILSRRNLIWRSTGLPTFH